MATDLAIVSDHRVPTMANPTGRRRVPGMRPDLLAGYLDIVDGALQTPRDGMLPKFNLHLTPEMVTHLQRWLGMALNSHVEELSITVMGVFFDIYRYPVPGWLFSAEFIKCLTLGFAEINEIDEVNLPLLRSLHLLCCHFELRMFQKLRACPVFEDLTVLSCSPIWEIEILNHNYLKNVAVAHMFPVITAVCIEAPDLECFVFQVRHLKEDNTGLVVHVSRSFRCLEFTGVSKKEKWFGLFLSEFPLLESLKLESCKLVKLIRISNPLLEKISNEDCDKLVDIRIDTPKLSSFYYETRGTLPRIWTENAPYSCAAGFSCFHLDDLTSLWFQELQNFLTGPSTTFSCSESTMHLYQWDKKMKDEMGGKLALSAPGVKHLKLVLKASKSSYSLILDGLFSVCRPTTFLFRAKYPLLKFICEALANTEENPECCPGEIKCWKHELKGTKIERVAGSQHRRLLDWGTLLSLLPALSASDEVCFKLQW